eukprot:6369025-Lingulodinium_polyedra.AAC.1
MYRVGLPGKLGPTVTMLCGSRVLATYNAMPAMARSSSSGCASACWPPEQLGTSRLGTVKRPWSPWLPIDR